MGHELAGGVAGGAGVVNRRGRRERGRRGERDDVAFRVRIGVAARGDNDADGVVSFDRERTDGAQAIDGGGPK